MTPPDSRFASSTFVSVNHGLAALHPSLRRRTSHRQWLRTRKVKEAVHLPCYFLCYSVCSLLDSSFLVGLKKAYWLLQES
jgi:hypothetical protein